jgi:acetyl esterase/lipase
MDAPDHSSLAEGPEIEGLWIEPVPDLIVDEIRNCAKIANVHPIRIPGYWVHQTGVEFSANEKPISGDKVIYGLHGGAYIIGSAASTIGAVNIYKGIMQHYPEIRSAFAIEYRLCVGPPYTPSGSFPAALMDALAGYKYLVNIVGCRPADIVIVGDSAGGNLALALTRYLVEKCGTPFTTHLPLPPGCIILCSPLTDLSRSHFTSGSSVDFSAWDLIPDPRTNAAYQYAIDSFLGPHGMTAAQSCRYISPACLFPSMGAISFKGFPRTFICSGSAETLLDQIRTLKDRMVDDMGEGEGDEQAIYYEAPDAVHNYLAISLWEPERSETLRRIANWLSSAQRSTAAM